MTKLHIGSIMYASSQMDIRDALEDLSSEINETYKKVMKRIRTQPPGDRELAERTLSWVFGSRRPLNTIELQHGLAIIKLKADRERIIGEVILHEEIIITACQGLLIQEREGNAKRFIRPVQYTAAEYFKKAYNEEFLHGHANITNSCVAYLSLNGLPQILGLYLRTLGMENALPRYEQHWRSESEDYPRILSEVFPLFSHAENHWASHLCDANALGLPILASNILWRYSGNSFYKWENWLNPTKCSYDVEYSDNIYRTVFESYRVTLGVLKQFTQREHDTNAADEDGRTMLFYAVDAGHEGAIEFLLAQHEIKIKESELESNDILYTAISKDLPGVVQNLLSMIAVHGEEDERDSKVVQSSKQSHGVYNLKRPRSL